MNIALGEHGPTCISLEWLLTCISFWGWLFAVWVGVFFPHLLAELEQVKCGLAMPQGGRAWEVDLLVVLSWVEICQVFLSVSCGGPGLATHIQLLFDGWREAANMVTTWLLNQKVNL